MTLHSSKVPAELVAKYDTAGPRYTSYPTAPVWTDAFGDEEWDAALAEADKRGDEPLALYLHLPFCRKRCLFCACNVVITQRDDVLDAYLNRLKEEISTVASKLPNRRRVSGVHWGGGTPTHLSPAEIEDVWECINEHFELISDAEVSVEVHPPVTTLEQMQTLARLGFNRISLGVQDIDPGVQAMIDRNQTLKQTEDVLTWARELGFNSVNFDLIYGLPGQTLDTWNYTLDQVVRLQPNRLAIYSYAHVPWLHPHQNRMPKDQLPDPDLKLELLRTASHRLEAEVGYEEIGFDHFALPTDELATAVKDRKLYRNFMGYTVKPARDYIGFGMTAISEVGNAFAQNHSKLNRWNEAIDSGRCAVSKGHALSVEDRVRKLIIERLMCSQQITFAEVEGLSDEPFHEQFAAQWQALEDFEIDGLVIRGESKLTVTKLGRNFLRNICMLFDSYLEEQLREGRYSKTV
jgi:oxygen-independent coproporphyrinogen-3 oxidase